MISYEITCFVNYKYIDRKVYLYIIKGMQRLISFHSTRCYSTTISHYNQ